MHFKSHSIPSLFPTSELLDFKSPQALKAFRFPPDFGSTPAFLSALVESRESKREGSMDQYHGPIGNQAKLEYYSSFKKLPAISERNKFSKLKDTPNVAYLQEVDRKHLKPLPFGVIRPRGSEKCIDLNGKSMGDNYAVALSKSLKSINTLETINLKSNGLTERGANALLEGLGGQRLKELNLSDNRLGNESIEKLIFLLTKPNSELKILNLENVGVKESGLVRLVSCLGNNSTLIHLNLSKNSLTVQTAEALKTSLTENYSLQKLDLHWNNFNSGAGVVIFEGLTANRSLSELDFSWNSLGNNTQPINFERICKILASNKNLVHLDLSYNYLTTDEARVFAEYIKENHSLLGIHMEGNYSSVNANGFIEPDSVPKLKESALVFKRIFKTKKKTDNCWICGQWVEFTLSLAINRVPPVYIHFEQDGYEPYMLQYRESFCITRVFPAGEQKLFLSVTDQPFLSPEFETVKIKYPQEFKAEDRLIPIHTLNMFVVKGEKLNITLPFRTTPRIKHFHELTDSEERIPWLFENSIFKDYIKDSESLMSSCFELDWSLSKLEGFVRDADDKEKLKQYLKSVYRTFRLCYKSLSSFAASEVFSVGSNTMTDFLYQCKIIDSLYAINDFGVNWNSTNVSLNKNLLFNPGTTLVRYEFLEFIVRVAADRFIRSKTVKSVKKAIEKLMNEHVFPNIQEFRCNEIASMDTCWWRDTNYMVEDVDYALKVYRPVLEALFARYSGRKTLPGCKKFMCLEEFIDFCKDANLITDDICNREVTFCFVQAMMTQVDEYNKSRHFEMSFVEFLEGLSRVCDMRDTSPKSLFLKLTETFPSLLRLCPKLILDSFELPTSNTFHKLKFRPIKI